MSNVLMNQENEQVTPGPCQISSEAKTMMKLSNQSQRSSSNVRRYRNWRTRKPSFVIPPLPEFVPPELPNVEFKIRDPNIPRVMLPPPRFFEGPKITWPDVNNFTAVYLGTDKNSRVFLKFNDPKSVESYHRCKSIWGVFHVTLGKDAKIALSDIEVGLLVIASYKRHGQDHFIRAKVLSIQYEQKTATVRDVDEWDIIVVREENLYWMNTTFLGIHFQAIPCEIRGLNFFKGSPILLQIMQQCLGKYFPTKGVVRVTKFEGRYPYPQLNFSRWPYPAGTFPVDDQVKSILKNWRPKLPTTAGTFSEQILISHADSLGNIWLQMVSNLTYFLTQLKFDASEDLFTADENAPDSEKFQAALIASMENGEKMFLAHFLGDVYYRCRVLTFSSENRLAKVQFVDFGSKRTIKISGMMSYDRFFGEECVWIKDIKPQCVKVHMNGIDVINVDSFWEQLDSPDSRQDIMMSLSQKKDRKTPQVELYNYPNGDGGDMEHLNKIFLRKSNVARNIGGRKIGTNIRIPGTKKYLTTELVDTYEADFIQEKESTEEDWDLDSANEDI